MFVSISPLLGFEADVGRKRKQRRKQPVEYHPPSKASASSKQPTWRRWHAFLVGAMIAGFLGVAITHEVMSKPTPRPLRIDTERSATQEIPGVGKLVAMSDEELASQDLALINLVCAQGLPGSEDLDVNKCLRTLDGWAKHVKLETDRHFYRVTDPRYRKEYPSEAFFRASMMLQVLQQDLGVHYSKERIRNIDFTQSKDLFLHGMIGEDNGGTCVSMPVLYTAVGRRLGYPIKLVLAKAHVFCRWDAPSFGQGDDQFNIEGAGEGFSSFDNDYFKKWPEPLSEAEANSGYYLRSLTPREELAVFLSARGHCLEDTGKFEDACLAYSQSMVLAPKSPQYRTFLFGAVRGKFTPMMAGTTAPRRRPNTRASSAVQHFRQWQRTAATPAWPNHGTPAAHRTGYRGPNHWDPNPGFNPQPGFSGTNPAQPFGPSGFSPPTAGQQPTGSPGL